MGSYFARMNKMNCAGQIVILVMQYILFIAGFFLNLFDLTMCVTSVERYVCKLPKAKTSLWDKDFVHYLNWR